MPRLHSTPLETPLGKVYLYATEEFLTHLAFEPLNLSSIPKENRILALAQKELSHYFSRKLTQFTIPLLPQGTPFQIKAWKALLKIGYGETRSYQEQASLAHSPRAIRAIGTANGNNPIPIIIPCHRVIRSDGSLGGYSGGLSIKRTLLALENQTEVAHFLSIK